MGKDPTDKEGGGGELDRVEQGETVARCIVCGKNLFLIKKKLMWTQLN